MSVRDKKNFGTTWGPNGPSGHKSADFVCFRPKNRPQKFLKIAFFWLFRGKFDIFFPKFYFCSQIIKNCFWGLFLFQKTVFMQFLAIFDKIKISNFGLILGPKPLIFDHFEAFLNFFFQNFFVFQKCQKMIKKCFPGLFECLKTIFMQLWVIYDNSEILNFSKIFDPKKLFFHFWGVILEILAIFFQKWDFGSKMLRNDPKCLFWAFPGPKHYPYAILRHIWQT